MIDPTTAIAIGSAAGSGLFALLAAITAARARHHARVARAERQLARQSADLAQGYLRTAARHAGPGVGHVNRGETVIKNINVGDVDAMLRHLKRSERVIYRDSYLTNGSAHRDQVTAANASIVRGAALVDRLLKGEGHDAVGTTDATVDTDGQGYHPGGAVR